MNVGALEKESIAQAERPNISGVGSTAHDRGLPSTKCAACCTAYSGPPTLSIDLNPKRTMKNRFVGSFWFNSGTNMNRSASASLIHGEVSL